MRFASQHDMVDDSIVDVSKAIDRLRGIIPRADYLELVFSDVLYDYTCLLYTSKMCIRDRH